MHLLEVIAAKKSKRIFCTSESMAPQALEENRMPHIEKPHIVEDRLERMILEAKLLLKGVQEVEQKTKVCQCEAKDSCEVSFSTLA